MCEIEHREDSTITETLLLGLEKEFLGEFRGKSVQVAPRA